MKTRTFIFALLATATAVAWGGSAFAQSYPPPPPPYDPGPRGYDQAAPGYDDQAPYYDPRPDGNYADSYDQGYDSGYDNQGPVDESLFYSELSPYGRWIQRGSYGWVWEPTRVEVGWRPYTRGRWVQSDYGWTWLSDEPWGW